MAFKTNLQRSLEQGLRRILRDIRWSRIHDFGPTEDSFPEGPAPVLNVRPNIDLAVLAFDQNNQLAAAANVLISRDAPKGFIAELSENLEATDVVWQRWNQQRWDGNEDWAQATSGTRKDQLLRGDAEAGELPFMSPYPASLFAVPLAYFVMEEVERGTLNLKRVRQPLADALRVSSNEATRELLQLLHERGLVNKMNRRFEQLGLGTIQIKGTDPPTGSDWQVDKITMTSLDTTKLFWLLTNDQPQQILWRNTKGEPVRSSLNASSRSFLQKLLTQEAFNEALSTSNFGVYRHDGRRKGPAEIQAGIPGRAPARWIDPVTGVVRFESDGTLFDYGEDVRPFNRDGSTREFSHKTGLTYNFGSDGGIVRPLDDDMGWHYVVAFNSNLGYRYTDREHADAKSYPLYGDPSIAYTQEIPRLGRHLDQLLEPLLHG